MDEDDGNSAEASRLSYYRRKKANVRSCKLPNLNAKSECWFITK